MTEIPVMEAEDHGREPWRCSVCGSLIYNVG
jgi:hypothetical protein